MLEFLEKYSGNVHSQNGEDLIIAECVKRLGIKLGHACDVGCHDGLWMSNVRLLIESGWSATLIEANVDLYRRCCANWSHRRDVKCIHAHVDESNINALVDETCDLLSLDTDGPDYSLFRALKANPKIVIIEIDSSIPPDQDYISAQGGAGFLPMATLIQSKGMFVLAHTGNIVALREEFHPLFPEIDVDPAEHPERYFNYDVLTGDRKWLDR